MQDKFCVGKVGKRGEARSWAAQHVWGHGGSLGDAEHNPLVPLASQRSFPKELPKGACVDIFHWHAAHLRPPLAPSPPPLQWGATVQQGIYASVQGSHGT